MSSLFSGTSVVHTKKILPTKVYVVNGGDGTVSVIDPNNIDKRYTSWKFTQLQ
jgi:DNA-binding beta-propeller fold protein YncE